LLALYRLALTYILGQADSLNLFFPKLGRPIQKLHADHRVVRISLSASTRVVKV